MLSYTSLWSSGNKRECKRGQYEEGIFFVEIKQVWNKYILIYVDIYLLFYAEIRRGKALLETMSSEGIISVFYKKAK